MRKSESFGLVIIDVIHTNNRYIEYTKYIAPNKIRQYNIALLPTTCNIINKQNAIKKVTHISDLYNLVINKSTRSMALIT